MTNDWKYTPETESEWAEWMLITNYKELVIRRIDPYTKLKQDDFDPDEWKCDAGYRVMYNFDHIVTLPLDTPLEHVKALAIAHVRLA